MRKRMLMLAALAAMAFAAALANDADAAAPAGALARHIGAETFTPIRKANCFGFGGWLCRPGWHHLPAVGMPLRALLIANRSATVTSPT